MAAHDAAHVLQVFPALFDVKRRRIETQPAKMKIPVGEKRTIDGISWRIVREEYESVIQTACASEWNNATLIRQVPHRRVLRFDGMKSIVVKEFIQRGLWARVQGWLRGDPAYREWKRLLEARRRGLNVPEPIALGDCRRTFARGSFLVTEALQDTRPLDACLWGESRLFASQRRKAIEQSASLIREAHDRGIYQQDLHPGNILIRASGDGIKALLIDLQRVKIVPPLTLQERWQNLSILQGGCTHASSTDRLRFLKQYLAYPTPLPIDLRPLVSQLEQKGRRHRFSLWRSRQKRCVAENREFMKIQAGSFFGFARRDCWHQDLQRLLREPERILAHPETQLVKRSTTTSVAVVRQSAGRLYVKRYNYQGLGYAIKDLFRSARARRAWIAANSLHMRGIPVALPVAYLERRRLGLLLDSYVLTEAKSGRNLRVVLNDYDRSAASVNTKRALLNAMARLVRKMHDRGVAHRDLKAPNVIAQAGPNNVCELFIVDFDGISLGVVSRNRREKNLARLAQERHRHRCLTRTDRLRFLKAYLATNDKKAWKKVWQAVDRHSR